MVEILIGLLSFIAGAVVVHCMWVRAVRNITNDIRKTKRYVIEINHEN